MDASGSERNGRAGASASKDEWAEDSFSEDESSEEEQDFGSDSLMGSSDESDKEDTTREQTVKEQSARDHDEYAEDSSDEEDLRNTVGNIPMSWYERYAHTGYSIEGKRLVKPPQQDQLEELISKVDDPNYWRSVKDDSTGQSVVLNDADVDVIQRMQRKRAPHGDINVYQEWDTSFEKDVMHHPVTNTPASKQSFIPSLSEKKKVSYLVHAIKMGWITPRPEKPKRPDEDDNYFFDLWGSEDQAKRKARIHFPAAKPPLPTHAASYNPPPEYLFTEEEKKRWEGTEAGDRRQNFVPAQYSSYRLVPGYGNLTQEIFERCLDLYLCPRSQKMKMRVNAEDLIPKLPQPKDLQPYPTTLSVVYKGHTGSVQRLSVDPTGQWLASAGSDGAVRVWEVATGRCLAVYALGETVRDVAWNPNPKYSLVAVAVDKEVVLLNPGRNVLDSVVVAGTDELLQKSAENAEGEGEESGSKAAPAKWSECVGAEYREGLRFRISHDHIIHQLSWHGRGDYLVSVQRDAGSKAVVIHQLSRRRSQAPFTRNHHVQIALFHPSKPVLFVATQRHVRVYHLMKQGELLKKLMTNVKWVSSMDIHPGGDNLIVGSYDSRLSWMDLDLSSKPFQTLRHHKKALRQVCYHKRYPLFASASDDGTVIVCHGQVFDDLLKPPVIVPVKILRGHTGGARLLGCTFHPSQPWLFSSATDGRIHLYT